MRYALTAATGLQDTQILEWSDRTTLTLLTRRLAEYVGGKYNMCVYRWVYIMCIYVVHVFTESKREKRDWLVLPCAEALPPSLLRYSAVTSTLYRVSGRRDCRRTCLLLPGNNTYKESHPAKTTLPMMHNKSLKSCIKHLKTSLNKKDHKHHHSYWMKRKCFTAFPRSTHFVLPCVSSQRSVGHVVLQHMSIRRKPAHQQTDCSLLRDGHTSRTSSIHWGSTNTPKNKASFIFCCFSMVFKSRVSTPFGV